MLEFDRFPLIEVLNLDRYFFKTKTINHLLPFRLTAAEGHSERCFMEAEGTTTPTWQCVSWGQRVPNTHNTSLWVVSL